MSLYHLNVSVHVLAAMLWLGGMFFLGVVGAPVLRRIEPPALRAQLFNQLGRAFRTAGWSSIAVLLITGVLNLHFRGLLDTATLGSDTFWATPYGHALALKLVTVVLMLTLSAIHDFIHGPATTRHQPGSPAALRHRRRAAWLARLNALLGLILVFAAVRLARGGL
jgi:uncharacterized membrane protein